MPLTNEYTTVYRIRLIIRQKITISTRIPAMNTDYSAQIPITAPMARA